MGERGYKEGLISRVKNKHSGKRYIVSTVQEAGEDYWTTAIFPTCLGGLCPATFKPVLVWTRNTKEEAHKIHWKIKEIVIEEPEQRWIEISPCPIPPNGYTEGAKRVFKKKLGYIPKFVKLLEKKENQDTFEDLIEYLMIKKWIEGKSIDNEKVNQRESEQKIQNSDINFQTEKEGKLYLIRCTNCLKENPSTNNYCTNCGTKLIKET